MLNWITVNLPYNTFNSFEYDVQMPDLDPSALEALGFNKETLNSEHDVLYGQAGYFYAIEELDDLEEKNLSDEEFKKRLFELSPMAQVFHQYRVKYKIHSDWREENPIWKSYWAEYDKAENSFKEKERLKSFVGQGLNQPGTLIEIQTEEGTKQFLIGHINQCAGMESDECQSITDDTVVIRYCVVWSPENCND